MPENGREQREAKRRAKDQASRAHAARREQDEAAERRQEWEKRRNRSRTAYILMVVGVVVAGSHILEHLGVIRLLPNAALQDILIGYPTAGVLVVLGLAMLPAQKY